MGTNGYIRQRGLTIEQRNAIDLLVTGKTDTETAEAVGVHRVTVTKWRNADPLAPASGKAGQIRSIGVEPERKAVQRLNPRSSVAKACVVKEKKPADNVCQRVS
jgi:transposase